MHYLLLAIGILLGIFGLYRFFLNATVKQISAAFMVGGFLVICAALFFLAITGRLPAALGLLAALWPIGLSIWHHKRNPRPQDKQNREYRPSSDKPMTHAEALNVLGLAEGATKDEIRAAHKKLIKKLHPDQEGSEWLAAKINEARDFLLQEVRND